MRRLITSLFLALALYSPVMAQNRSTSDIAADMQRLVDELRAVPPPTPAVVTVPTGVDLGKVAVTEVVLTAGGVYPGFTLAHPLKIVGVAGLQGRTTKVLEGQLPKVAGQVIVPKGVCGLSMEGIEVIATTAQDLIVVEGCDVSLNHMLIHGLPTGTKRGVAMNGANISVTNSSVYDFKIDKAIGSDAQAIAGWNGAGPFLIDNNYLEGSTENIIFGGSDPSTPGLIPSDITITNNTIAKPVEWKGSVWSVKNLIELKNAQRVKIAFNTFQYSWKAAQDGYAVVLNVRNQDGKCPWCTVGQVDFVDNLLQHMGSGINILGRDDQYPSVTMDNILIARNTFEDVNRGLWGGDGRTVFIQGGPSNLRIVDNKFLQAGTKQVNSFLSLDQPQYKLVGLVITGNEGYEGAYGIIGGMAPAIGVATLEFYAPGYTWGANTLHKGLSGNNYKYPVGTLVVP